MAAKPHCHDLSELFCMNEGCPAFQKVGAGNIKVKGHTGKNRDILELLCSECGKAFSERKGTALFNVRLPIPKFLNVIAHVLEGNGVRGTARLVGCHRDTVVECLRRAGAHALAVINAVLVGLGCREVQMDELWSFVGKKEKNLDPWERVQKELGDRWVHLATDPVTRLILGHVVGRRTQEKTDQLVGQVVGRLAAPDQVLYTSDEHEPYLVAMKCVDARFRAARAASRSTPVPSSTCEGATTQCPSTSPTGLVFATVKKERREGRIVRVERTLQIGTPEDLKRHLQASTVSTTVNTSFIERINLSFRHFGRRLTRKTPAFSKKPDCLDSQIALEVAAHNFVRPHGTLSRAAQTPSTPAMRAGLSERPWSLLDLFTFRAWLPQNAGNTGVGGFMST